MGLHRGDWRSECGGALIYSNKVITAAQCFGDVFEPRNWKVKAGNILAGDNGRDENEQIKQVKAIHSPLVNNSHYLFYY